MDFVIASLILLLSIVIDLIISDPSPNTPWTLRYKLHPTVMMGKLAQRLKILLRKPNSPRIEKFNGVLLALIVVTTFVIPTYFILKFIKDFLGIVPYIIISAFMLKMTICIKLETDWAYGVSKALQAEDLVEARKYAHFSRRDPSKLNSSQISSSVIESMAENLADFRLSPLFYYGIFGVLGAIAYRAINTLDGVVGFKDPEHINIGWFSATLDTVVNYIPTRITAFLIILASWILGEDYRIAWKIALRDRKNVQSRNHGWTMAAMAGALNVRLEKPGHYIIYNEGKMPSHLDIMRALNIRNAVIFLFLALVVTPLLYLSTVIFRF
ncbi:MAG: cobalamin biosynthesis protein [Candidatus Bathyarchaeia archaeon]